MNKSLRCDFLGTEGDFYWYTPNWLGKWICKFTKKHKDDDPEWGNLHCLRCNKCLYKFADPELQDLLCPHCQMSTDQYERWINCEKDDCLQECLHE